MTWSRRATIHIQINDSSQVESPKKLQLKSPSDIRRLSSKPDTQFRIESPGYSILPGLGNNTWKARTVDFQIVLRTYARELKPSSRTESTTGICSWAGGPAAWSLCRETVAEWWIGECVPRLVESAVWKAFENEKWRRLRSAVKETQGNQGRQSQFENAYQGLFNRGALTHDTWDTWKGNVETTTII